MSDLTQEIIEARKKMEEKFGNLKLGGKGTQKRKKIVVHKPSSVQDKKIVSIAKKSGAKNIGETAEINVFKDDNTVLHFKKPKIEYSVKEKVTFVTGAGETKRKYKEYLIVFNRNKGFTPKYSQATWT
jgi:nascent polypeptide-associated complex subunit beta